MQTIPIQVPAVNYSSYNLNNHSIQNPFLNSMDSTGTDGYHFSNQGGNQIGFYDDIYSEMDLDMINPYLGEIGYQGLTGYPNNGLLDTAAENIIAQNNIDYTKVQRDLKHRLDLVLAERVTDNAPSNNKCTVNLNEI
ncbi:hypothetical protein J1614_002225 [Plenodomus biglobosus]|nr:hypothetical protein J1614_002225 [Plenodomus biglobosus]